MPSRSGTGTNKRPMGHIAHLSLYHNEKEIFTFWELNGSSIHLNKFKFPSPKDTLCHVWLKLVQWFWRKRIKSFVNVFLLSRNYLLLKKGVALHLNNLSLLHQRMLCVKVRGINPVVLKKICKCFQYNFTISLLSPLGKGHSFFE